MAELYRMMEKIARGHTLNVTEIRDLINKMRELDEIRVAGTSWLSPGSSQPNIDTLTARRADIETPPGNPFFCYWFDPDIADGYNSLNNAWTPIDFTDARFLIVKDNPCAIRLDGDKIYPNYPNSYVQLNGRFLWHINGTGARNLAISHYDSADALIQRRSLHDTPSAGTGTGTHCFANSFRPTNATISSDPNQYFKIEVAQSSGGTLGLAGIDFSIEVAFR